MKSKIPFYNFPSYIELFNLSDIHRGSPNCNIDLLHKTIEKIQNTKNAYWISVGDLLDVALKNSKSDVYSNISPEKERETIIRELSPIADKCLGIVESNHHGRISKETGLSIDKIICESLGIKNKFLGALGVIRIKCNKTPYYIAFHHGTGGGQTRGSKSNGLNKLENLVSGADAYLEGHTHSYAHFVDTVNYIDKKRGLFKSYKAHFCCTGHFLEWSGSYAQNLKLKPMPMGSSKLTLIDGRTGRYEDKKILSDLYD